MAPIAAGRARPARPLPVLRWLWARWGDQRRLRRVRRSLPGILAKIQASTTMPWPEAWTGWRVLSEAPDMTVIAVGRPARPPSAIVKLPWNERTRAALGRQKAALAELHDDERLGDWRALLPVVLAAGKVEGQPYIMERALPGRPAGEWLARPGARERLVRAAAATIGKLHQATAAPVGGQEHILLSWIDRPLAQLQEWRSAWRGREARDAALDDLRNELWTALSGHSLSASWVHGDLWASNLLIADDGARVVGLVDWGSAEPDGLPLLDVVHLLLTTRMWVWRVELGRLVCEFMRGAGWTAPELDVLDSARQELACDEIDYRALVRLTWLRHVVNNLTKTDTYASHWLWASRNVESVLRCG